MEAVYQFSGALWEYSGEAPWVFITLGGEDADEIRTRVPPSGGFGSVNANAQIGETKWSTSIFADKASGSYLLPIKRGVRVQENLVVGDVASVILRIDLD
jgi:hypothetical protein